MNGLTRDEEMSDDKRNELIADYQRIVDDAKSGKVKVEAGMLKFAQGRLAELSRIASSN